MPRIHCTLRNERRRQRVESVLLTGRLDGWSVRSKARTLRVSQHVVRAVEARLGWPTPERVIFRHRLGKTTTMDTTRIHKPDGRAWWTSRARQNGVEPDHLHGLAAELLADERQRRGGRLELLKQARQLTEALGYGSVRGMRQRQARGDVDAASVRGLDDVAELLHRQHPEEFAGHDDKTARLFDILAEGNPEPVNVEDAYRRAFERFVA